MTTHDPTIDVGPRQPDITTPAGASTRILDGLGLTASESVEDSEDRSIWRWTIDVRGGS